LKGEKKKENNLECLTLKMVNYDAEKIDFLSALIKILILTSDSDDTFS